jgi:hypothetical protein
MIVMDLQGGTVRHPAFCSILAAEWANVKARLRSLLR